MIVIDTSALIAILTHEPERMVFYQVIASADRCFVSAVSYQEAGQVVFARSDINGLHDLEDLLALIKAEIVPQDIHLAAFALEAFRERHPLQGSAQFLRLRSVRFSEKHERAVAVQRR